MNGCALWTSQKDTGRRAACVGAGGDRAGALPVDKRGHTSRPAGAQVSRIRLGLTAGQAHDGQIAAELLDHLGPRTIVLADKAYDADRIRELIQNQGATPSIRPKSNRRCKPCFSNGSSALT
jgi:hypothetical protein